MREKALKISGRRPKLRLTPREIARRRGDRSKLGRCPVCGTRLGVLSGEDHGHLIAKIERCPKCDQMLTERKEEGRTYFSCPRCARHFEPDEVVIGFKVICPEQKF